MSDIVERLLEEIKQCALELEEAANVFDGTGFPALARVYRASATRARAALAQQPLSVQEGWQDRVAGAHHALFHDDPTDIEERRARFAEEVNETLQAFGMSREDMHRLVDYSWDRPVGEPAKEIGAALLTLTSLCVIAGYDLMACGEADLEKLQRPETIARIRAKRATRHGRGPLPGFDPAVRIAFGLEAQGHITTVEAMLAKGEDWQEIGRCIGWDGETAKQYYQRHLDQTSLRDAKERKE